MRTPSLLVLSFGLAIAALTAACGGGNPATGDADAGLDGSTGDAATGDVVHADVPIRDDTDGGTRDAALVCDPGRLDCNASASDACEVTAATDPQNCGRCGHHCRGACMGGHCSAVEIGTGMGTTLTAAAVHDGTIYLAFLTVAGAQLMQVPTSGGAPTQVAFLSGLIGGIAFDGGRVFFTSGQHVRRVEPGMLMGSIVASTSLVTSSLFSLVRAGTTWYANDIAATCTTGPCCTAGHPCDPGRIWALPDGGAATIVAPAENAPRVLVSDATHLYWVDSSEKDYAGTGTIPYDQGTLRRLALGGGAPETLAGSLYRPQSLTLEGTDTAVFGAFDDRMPAMVRRVARSGGMPPTIVSADEGVQTTQIAAVPSGIVWNNIDRAPPVAEHLRFAPAGGGAVETLLDAPMVRGLAVDGEDVYVLTYATRTAATTWHLMHLSP